MGDARVVRAAAQSAGLDAGSVELIRHGSNSLYRLPGGVVARVGRRGGVVGAAREVAVATWLVGGGVDAVRPFEFSGEPVTVVDGRPVTWWHELGPHRPAETAELGGVLARLHALDVPDIPELPDLDPFAHCVERISTGTVLDADDQRWLLDHVARLGARWGDVVGAQSERVGVVHGDAWQGNVAVTGDGRCVLLDFEHVAVGPVEWDLAVIAADHTDFARLDVADYHAFVDAYGGYDVTAWAGCRVLADIWELRWTSHAIAVASRTPAAVDEARHRVRCLRGFVSRPWRWRAL